MHRVMKAGHADAALALQKRRGNVNLPRKTDRKTPVDLASGSGEVRVGGIRVANCRRLSGFDFCSSPCWGWSYVIDHGCHGSFVTCMLYVFLGKSGRLWCLWSAGKIVFLWLVRPGWMSVVSTLF